MNFEEINSSIKPFDQDAADATKKNWDAIAKPLESLGVLEDDIIRIAGLTGSPNVSLGKKGVLLFCADNGVVEEGVTQTGQDVTAVVAANSARGDASVCRMANVAGAKVFSIDMGTVYDAPGTIDRAIAKQTANFTKGPAMTREQTERAIQTGIDLVGELASQGYGIIATGEMGIGNTTTSSALLAVLLKSPVEAVTGRGAGLSDAGLTRKIEAIKKGIEVNSPDSDDAFDALCKLGGFDIAGIVGAFIGGAIYRVPILIDGFISATAALVAMRICPMCKQAMLASHISAEPATHMVLDALGLDPLICAGMHLGEGTGAVCAMPLLEMALAVYGEMVTFDATGIEAYTPQGGEQ